MTTQGCKPLLAGEKDSHPLFWPADVDQFAVWGWDAIFEQLCTVRTTDGRVIHPWGDVRTVRNHAEDLEHCGAISRMVLPCQDGIRRWVTLAWPHRFRAAMQVLASRWRKERLEKRRLRHAARAMESGVCAETPNPEQEM